MHLKYLHDKRYTGFTIVELLIVVGVIAILSAVTIVGYGAIRQSAESTVDATAIKKYVEALDVYAIKHSGKYPYQASCLGAKPSPTSTCRGFEYMGCSGAGVADGTVALAFSYSSDFDAAIAPYFSQPARPTIAGRDVKMDIPDQPGCTVTIRSDAPAYQAFSQMSVDRATGVIEASYSGDVTKNSKAYAIHYGSTVEGGCPLPNSYLQKSVFSAMAGRDIYECATVGGDVEFK